MKRLNDLESYWMPFTANRDFKKDPRMVVSADGMYYKSYSYCTDYITLADDTDSSENSMTFNYSFETKAGVTESGTVTLPVQQAVFNIGQPILNDCFTAK